MDWCKLPTSYYLDPRMQAAGEAAEVLYLRALAYAANAETGGLLTGKSLGYLSVNRREKRVRALIEAGLWEQVPDGYRIVDWDEWNGSIDALSARRKADRERKRKQREREAAETASRDTSDVGSRDSSRDVTPTEEEEEKETPPEGGQRPRAGARVPAREADDETTPWPPFAAPLVKALRDAGLGVSWSLRLDEWEFVRVAIDRSGVDALVDHARKRSANARANGQECAFSARAWVQEWRYLAPKPDDAANAAPTLPPPQASGAAWRTQIPTDHSRYETETL